MADSIPKSTHQTGFLLLEEIPHACPVYVVNDRRGASRNTSRRRRDVDVLDVTLTEQKIEETIEVSGGVVVDYDKDRRAVGAEVLNASASKDLERIFKQYVEQVKAA